MTSRGMRGLLRAYSLNWEMVLYTLILVVAVISRFYDLGGAGDEP